MSRLSTGHINACIKDLKKHTEHCIPAYFEENKDSILSNGIKQDPFWANGLFGRNGLFSVFRPKSRLNFLPILGVKTRL